LSAIEPESQIEDDEAVIHGVLVKEQQSVDQSESVWAEVARDGRIRTHERALKVGGCEAKADLRGNL
jgi:hypothetical protein